MSVHLKDVAVCSSVHTLLGLGAASTGILSTAITVGSFALSSLWIPAVIFAAPIAFTGICISLAYAFIPAKYLQKSWVNFAFHTGLLALSAMVTLAVAISFGVVTPAFALLFAAYYTFILFFFTFCSIITYLYPVKEGYTGSVDDVFIQALGSMGRINEVD